MYLDVKGAISRALIYNFCMYSLSFIIMAWLLPKFGPKLAAC
jgi:hypothetical protein